MSIEALKEQARRHEQDEEWSEALQVYVEAINRQSDDDQPDLGLYNRAGDLSTRLGDPAGAIEYYEQAVDLYLEAELPNNAIAILKKILRNLPERSEVFLRMGQIRAQQGFLTDARNNFLTYAEQKQQNGDMDEAFRALEEFADVAPGDVEVRLALADQLHAHERSPEALQQLARVYHQYSGRGETEAANGIEQRIREIDADFLMPEADALGGAGFETNVLGGDTGFDGGFDPDQPVEGAFDEIALDDPSEIAFDDGELSLDSDDVTLDETAVESDDAVAAVEDASDEDDAFDFSRAEAALSFDADDEDFEGIEDEPLDFGAAVFDEADGDFDTSDDRGTIAARSEDAEGELQDQDDWEVGADIEDAFISFDGADDAPAEAEAASNADDLSEWDIDVAEDGDAVEASDSDDDSASVEEFAFDAASEDAEAIEAHADNAVAEAAAEDESDAWPEPDADWTATEGPAALEGALEESLGDEDDGTLDDAFVSVEAEADDGPEGDLAFEAADDTSADEMSSDLPLLGFDGADESFDGESPQTEVATEAEMEPATAVALDDESADLDEVADLGWGVEPSEAEASTEEADDLWTEVPAEEADFAAAVAEDIDESVEEEVAAEELVAAVHADDVSEEARPDDPLDEDDEWIGIAAVAEDEDEEDVEEVAAAPALADFEAFSLTELREYVDANTGVGPAWERIGRLTLEEGDQRASAEAFEEAHLAYAQSTDYMSAMRCVRELLLGEPDQIEYHQKLVEYARQADDRTLLVSAYLELADCLTRTGAPAKARAVHGKVLEIDPTNRRAAAALNNEDVDANDADDAPEEGPEAGYVDLGSMVIEQGEKTTRWTVEAEEPAGEADFDFQDMLAQFKAKVAENVDVGDVKAHYDLGTAYKEMGLVEEAITEFQAALRADGQNLATYEMLGQCFMDKGQPEVAVRSLTRATEMPFDVEDELLGIYYYLGRAHEELGNHDDAVEYYEKIFALDINFEDVTERLRALR